MSDTNLHDDNNCNECRAMEKETANLRAQLAALTKERNDAIMRAMRIEARHEKEDVTQASRDAAVAQLAAVTKGRDKLQEERDKAMQEIESMRAEALALELQLTSVRADRDHWRRIAEARGRVCAIVSVEKWLCDCDEYPVDNCWHIGLEAALAKLAEVEKTK